MLLPAAYALMQSFTREELTSSDPRPVVRTMLRNLARRDRWPEADLSAGLAAVDRADPPGWNGFASGPDWYESIGEELRKDYRPRFAPALEVVDQGATGWRGGSLLSDLEELRQGVADDVDAIAETAGDVVGVLRDFGKGAGKAAKTARGFGMGGLLVGALVVIGGALAARSAARRL